jgi:Xaa-Pro aminopeptidase
VIAQEGPGARLAKLRRRLEEEGIACLLVTDILNVQYLSGFTGSSGQVVVTPERALFLADSRYHLRAEQETSGCEVVRVEGPKKPFQAVAEALLGLGLTEVYFESSLSYGTYAELAQELPGVTLKPGKDLIGELRMVKDAGELERIRAAAAVTDACYSFVLGILRPGITEREVAVEIECFFRRNGAERESFETIVASGSLAASPHASATEKPIEAGDLVLMDFGAIWHGYAADITRTVAVGRADDRQREAYAAVLQAQEAAIQAIRPGVKGRDVDQVARDVVADRGFGDVCYAHGLGHSLGKHVHDGPALSRTSEVVLAPGMVITVEPGIYDPEWGGIRIEDDVLVTDTGCELLTHSAKEFTVIAAG